jgi:hypothetical protein
MIMPMQKKTMYAVRALGKQSQHRIANRLQFIHVRVILPVMISCIFHHRNRKHADEDDDEGELDGP